LPIDGCKIDGYRRNYHDKMEETMAFSYMPGFGNDFETESLPGALPQGRNSPQRPAYGLYAEQFSGRA
jgi:homogentisate 1,2-dioxygenase